MSDEEMRSLHDQLRAIRRELRLMRYCLIAVVLGLVFILLYNSLGKMLTLAIVVFLIVAVAGGGLSKYWQRMRGNWPNRGVSDSVEPSK